MPKSRGISKASTSPPPAERDSARWLLLIHQIPPRPDYLRVKIGRRLRRVGAVAIKNSVYVLPASPEAYEDFRWIMKEIEEGGGDAFVSEGLLAGGLTDAEVRGKFGAVRNGAYSAILADVNALMKAIRPSAVTAGRGKTKSAADPLASTVERDLAKLRRRFETASALDFFGASKQKTVAAALGAVQDYVSQHAVTVGSNRSIRRHDGATWVTRRDVHVDRIGSAWLIRRFVDRRPRFRFVDAKHYAPRDGEIRFDMFEAEYTHVGDACSFETLVAAFVPRDAALREVAEIVHDVDCKDAKFQRQEAAGLARMITGVAARCVNDEDRIAQGSVLFENLYAAFMGRG